MINKCGRGTYPTGTYVADLALILLARGRRSFMPATKRGATMERGDAVAHYPRQTRKPT